MSRYKKKHLFTYYLVRIVTFPFSLMPYSWIHFIGKRLGSFAYYVTPGLRKIVFNNLALAKNLSLNEKQIKKIAKGSYQNLIINGLEYFRLHRSRYKIDRFVTGHNLESINRLIRQNQGFIAVTGHIGNWELSFLHHTMRHKAIAVGKSIKNKKLYSFINGIREMHGGKIIEMKQALNYGLKMMRKGTSFSMVNDQASVDSSYSYPFLGTRAWTPFAPALIAYKANAPIVIVTTRRLKGGKYRYDLSDPIWPDRSVPFKKEVTRLMDEVMKGLENHIARYPEQWLWHHRRWKQAGFYRIHNKYKADSLLFVLPREKQKFDLICQGLSVLPKIYRRSFLTFFVPREFTSSFPLPDAEIIPYDKEEDLYIRDYRFQIIFDFIGSKKLGKHFLKLGAHTVYTLEDLLKTAPAIRQPFDMEELFKKSLCLHNTFFA